MSRLISINAIKNAPAAYAMPLKEAQTECDKYQYLLGRSFVNRRGNLMTIEAVLVCPFDNLNKWIWVNYYLKYSDNQKALHFYSQNEYDVVFLVREELRDDVQHTFENEDFISRYCLTA
jgi:hypothetical protein